MDIATKITERTALDDQWMMRDFISSFTQRHLADVSLPALYVVVALVKH